MSRAALFALCASLALAPVALADEPPRGEGAAPARGLADFEATDDVERARAAGGALAIERGPCPSGEAWARVTSGLAGDAAAVASGAVELAVALPDGVDLTAHQGVALSVRASWPEGGPEPALRLLARDATGAVLFTRLVRTPRRGAWAEVAQPFELFRWGERVGAWSDVRALALEARGALALEVDALRLLAGQRGAASAWPSAEGLEAFAFPAERGLGPPPPSGATPGASSPDAEPSEGGPAAGEAPAAGARPEGARPWRRDAGPFRIIGAPTTPQDEAVLGRIAARLRPLGPWLARIAPEAARPLHDGPVVVLMLEDPAAYARFFERLGGAWRVRIAPPGGAGYTVQDLCAFAYDARLGLDRPVLLHEAVHALAARRLRLDPGNAAHRWLQEGLANFLQISLFPDVMAPRAWAQVLRRDPSTAATAEGGLLLPLARLEAGEVPIRAYPQVASLVAFLVTQRPGRLGALARGVAAGEPSSAVRERLGLADLEREWLAWARETLGGPRPEDAQRAAFAPPREWLDAR